MCTRTRILNLALGWDGRPFDFAQGRRRLSQTRRRFPRRGTTSRRWPIPRGNRRFWGLRRIPRYRCPLLCGRRRCQGPAADGAAQRQLERAGAGRRFIRGFPDDPETAGFAGNVADGGRAAPLPRSDRACHRRRLAEARTASCAQPNATTKDTKVTTKNTKTFLGNTKMPFEKRSS